MQDFGLEDVAWALGSLLVVSVIGILWTRRAAIVSTLSGDWRSSLDRARQQKAAREWANNMSSISGTGLAVPKPKPVPGSDLAAISISTLADYLTKEQYIELGARMRNEKGKALFSGKKLYVLAGGNYGEFTALMRRYRGDEIDPDPPEEPVSHTPIVGRATKASFQDTL